MLFSTHLKKTLVPAAFSPGRSQAGMVVGLEGASQPLAGQLLRMGRVGAEDLALALLSSAALKPQLQPVGAKVGFASLFCWLLPIKEGLVTKTARCPAWASPSGQDALPGCDYKGVTGLFQLLFFVQNLARRSGHPSWGSGGCCKNILSDCASFQIQTLPTFF